MLWLFYLYNITKLKYIQIVKNIVKYMIVSIFFWNKNNVRYVHIVEKPLKTLVLSIEQRFLKTVVKKRKFAFKYDVENIKLF